MAKKVLRCVFAFVANVSMVSLSCAAEAQHGGVQLWENGPYWAECNLGANNPEESGCYFKWGDTTGYKPEGGSWTDNYPDRGYSGVTWVTVGGRRLSESPFATSKGRGNSVLDASGNLKEEDDAATVNLGKPWRIPTDADFEGLVRNCRTSWTSRGGVPGLLVTGKGTYASKSIFLPAAGCGEGDWIHFYRPSTDGYYWASTTYPGSSILACDLAVWSDGASCGGRLRGYGQCIRPVWGSVSKVKWTIRNGELTDVDLNGETDIMIPNSVEIIGADAFRYCHYDLKSVVVPDSVTLIGAHAFADCRELTSVILGRGVTRIESSAFRGCGALRSVMLLKTSLPSCGSDAFKQVPEGCVVYVDRLVGDLRDGDRWNDLIVVNAPLPYDTATLSQPTFTIQYGKLRHVALNGATEVVIPSSVTQIEYDAFDNCPELKSVLIPVSVTSMYSGTFRMCNNLTNITMLASVAHVDDGLFQGCDQLTSVTIGGGVKEIGSDTFRYCDRLCEVVLCGSVKEIGFETFARCHELRNVMIGDGVTSIGERAFDGCHRLATMVIPDSVTCIGESAFEGCNELTKLTIGRGLVHLGENALCGCHNLEKVILPDSVTCIEIGAFADCRELKVATYCPADEFVRMVEWTIRNGEILEEVKLNKVSEVTIPSFVVSIRNRAFVNCGVLKSIAIPNSVSDIEVGTFDYCNGLANFSVEAGNTNYSSANGLLLSKDGKLLVRGVNDDVIIPVGVVSIGDRAFYDCCDLMSVTMPNGVARIGRDSFAGCSSLKCVMIPSSVTSIDGVAFRGCHDLSVVYVDKGDCERVKGLCAWPSNVEFVEFVAPVVAGDIDAKVTGDAVAGFVIKPSAVETDPEVMIPQGVDAAKVTVEVSPKVASVKPNGAMVKVVVGSSDITDYLVMPESGGVLNIAAAMVKEEIVKEALDPCKDAVIELNAANPRLTTAPTRKGLTYTLFEGHKLESLSKGDSKLGDGDSWTPTITVSGGNAAFYSIDVTK